MVIESLQPGVADAEGGGQPADLGLRFDEDGPAAAAHQLIGGGEAGEPGPDHDDRLALGTHGSAVHGPEARARRWTLARILSMR